jgi:hypothetical protein
MTKRRRSRLQPTFWFREEWLKREPRPKTTACVATVFVAGAGSGGPARIPPGAASEEEEERGVVGGEGFPCRLGVSWVRDSPDEVATGQL